MPFCHRSTEERLESENDFSVFCIWAEAKLVRVHFAQMGTLLEEVTATQLTGLRQLKDAWDAIMEPVEGLVHKLDVFSPFHRFTAIAGGK